MGLQQKRRGQETGRHQGASVVETVEVGKLLVLEQLVAHLRQLPVGAVLAHQVSEVVLRIQQAPLRRPFTLTGLTLSDDTYPPSTPNPGVSVRTSRGIQELGGEVCDNVFYEVTAGNRHHSDSPSPRDFVLVLLGNPSNSVERRVWYSSIDINHFISKFKSISQYINRNLRNERSAC